MTFRFDDADRLTAELTAEFAAADTLARIAEPFPESAIEERDGGGNRKFSYISGETAIRRLNRAAVEWDFRIVHREWTTTKRRRKGNHTPAIFDEVPMIVVTGELTIPGLGTRTGIGVQVVDDGGGEDLVKGASTDALKKAATMFGMALELYGKDLEADAGGSQQVAHNQRWAEAMSQLLLAQTSLGWSDDELRSFAAGKLDVSVEKLPVWSAMKASYIARFAALIAATVPA